MRRREAMQSAKLSQGQLDELEMARGGVGLVVVVGEGGVVEVCIISHSGIEKQELLTMIFELRKIVDLDKELIPMPSIEGEIAKLIQYKKDHSINYVCPLCNANVGLWCD